MVNPLSAVAEPFLDARTGTITISRVAIDYTTFVSRYCYYYCSSADVRDGGSVVKRKHIGGIWARMNGVCVACCVLCVVCICHRLNLDCFCYCQRTAVGCWLFPEAFVAEVCERVSVVSIISFSLPLPAIGAARSEQ